MQAPLVLYLVVLGFTALLGFHRLSLLARYFRYRSQQPKPLGCFRELPLVCVQLPIYNEGNVVKRLLHHVSRIRYPKELLEIQVLDDSTDGSSQIVAELVSKYQSDGFRIVHHRRSRREGFKAGALAEGLRITKAEFVAVFDADFAPPPSFLERTIDFFSDSSVGMVQVRWGHLNRFRSGLTRAQAILLDGHFLIEHTARHRSGCFFNFNGTAGIWRKATIDKAGGWQGDTLTEDLDLSYRAQMAGDSFIYLVDDTVPAELPEEIDAFKSQQHRWTKGSVQVFRKLFLKVMRSRIPLSVKLEACFHFIANFCYPAILFLGLFLMPLIEARRGVTEFPLYYFDRMVLVFGLFSVCVYYAIANKEARGVSWLRAWRDVPLALVTGIALSFSNTFAIIEGLMNAGGEFTRTPKLGQKRPKKRGHWRPWTVLAECALVVYFGAALFYAFANGYYLVCPFVCLFFLGFAGFAFEGLKQFTQTQVVKS